MVDLVRHIETAVPSKSKSAGLLELTEIQRRTRDVDGRNNKLVQQRDTLVAQRHQLANDNNVQRRVANFARRAVTGIDKLDFEQRQQLIRLLVETRTSQRMASRDPAPHSPRRPPQR
jgi:hypothetical protein